MNYELIIAYNEDQLAELNPICRALMDEIKSALPDASAKIYHANPAWFINDNPIVGYDVAEDHVNLLFWSGQSFDEPDLEPHGKFKAAGTSYNSVSDIDAESLRRWLEKSLRIQWNYKDIRTNEGKLTQLVT